MEGRDPTTLQLPELTGSPVDQEETLQTPPPQVFVACTSRYTRFWGAFLNRSQAEKKLNNSPTKTVNVTKKL